MKHPEREPLIRWLVSIILFAAFCGTVWAASDECTYTDPGTGGSGIGGTGMPANGSGMGGTGISPKAGINKMHLAGNVIFSQGNAEAQINGHSRRLAKGSPVCEGETIVTARSAKVQIRMVDDGLIAVRPLTQFKIEKFAYTGTNADNSVFVLIKGGLRVATGKIGQQYPQNDIVKTPDALIGVLGTDHEAMVILPGDSRGYPAGTYDKVNKGITFIKTAKGTVNIRPDQVGYVANIEALPVLLQELPGFYILDPAAKRDSANKRDDNENINQSKELSGEKDESSTSSENKIPSVSLPDDMKIIESPEPFDIPDIPEVIELPDSQEQSNN